ncbi:ribulose-phosphate 3-epimerase [Candidatus Erwinia haradaeae]|uniref:Ribulose-phosphate 3-epimerase n=1 Tax=Candidatus Erwinia haradaeae TaxID=1922217 RepID=A0A451D3N0_9GAMM|nr:ribulose-phosphate 3-epimerase [Candidatus Erwinia haradaeae]VFP80258.1 Ribulose-phosphate 3-epimerase [Candidatus Erwinia haradaeae]
MKKCLIAPSILSADFARLGEDISQALDAGGDIVHCDVMDNHYVPNLTMGPMVIKALRDYGVTAPIDVHLMITPVERIIPDFAKAGASYITFHPEASNHIDRTLQLIAENGCNAGLALNPATPLNILDYVMQKINIILLMSVNPGFSKQSFIPSTLHKIRQVRALIDKSGYNICLAVDGGITIKNIKNIATAGADMFIVGSTLFDRMNYKKTIEDIRFELNKI